MKRGLILTNAYSKLCPQIHQAQRLQQELEKRGAKVDVQPNDGFLTWIEGDNVHSLAGEYDFCVYLDKDKYVSEMLEKSGLRLFNRHQAIRVCDDKMQTYIQLAGSGIAMVKTLPGLFCYTKDAPVKEQTLSRIEQRLGGYPIIVKESFGSLGKGVYMANERKALAALAEKLKCKEHLFQEAVKTSLGRDVRVIVIGGKVCAAMLRRSQTDFRSNIQLGGVGAAFTPDLQMVRLCERAAEIIGLDYCGIDVLFGEGDTPVLCEVNSNAFFEGIEKVTGINVAARYAEHILSQG